jgi:hypothetical protein
MTVPAEIELDARGRRLCAALAGVLVLDTREFRLRRNWFDCPGRSTYPRSRPAPLTFVVGSWLPHLWPFQVGAVAPRLW